MTILAYSLLTIPDLETGRKLHNLVNLDDKGAAKAIFHLQAQKTGSESLPTYLQRVAAIAVAIENDKGELKQQILANDDEGKLLSDFFSLIEQQPMLAVWNSQHDAQDVICLRSVKHKINVSAHYLSEKNHISLDKKLCQNKEVSLFEMATLLGIEMQATLDDRTVWEHFLKDEKEALYHIQENAAMNTLLIYKRQRQYLKG